MAEFTDEQLGMHRPITRRQFIDGVAVAVGAFAVGGTVASAAGQQGARRSGGSPAARGASAARPASADGEYYPPRWTGGRGYNEGVEAIPHSLADGTFWTNAAAPRATGEHYDLVVVGGGISGLSAARYFQQQFGDDVRILVIEAMDDVGGHARRNEFVTSSGRTLVGYGGSQSIDAPSTFAAPARDLLADIGIEVDRFEEFFDGEFNRRHGLSRAYYFDAAGWGADHLTISKGRPWEEVLADAPMSDLAKAKIAELYAGETDYLDGLADVEKKDVLAAITYRDYLETHAGADADTLKFFQTTPNGNWAYGADAVGALDAAVEFVGFDGLGLDWDGDPDPRLAPTSHKMWVSEEEYIYHFPEGNHGVVKALIRRMIPAALPGEGMEAISITPLDYAQLDIDGNDVRIRLSSPVVKVAHDGPLESATQVSVSYANGGSIDVVTADHVVLACHNNLIPFLTDELGPEQVAALTEARRLALAYATVQVRNWQAWKDLGISGIRFPTGYWDSIGLDFPVSLGSYEFPDDPAEPMLLHAGKAYCAPGEGHPMRQAQLGREQMMQEGFEAMERELRAQLQAVLGDAGFDAATDIEAITINRWPHGYTYEYALPWDTFWPDGPIPSHTGRARFGRVAIANTDSAPRAYVDSAMDMAYRAVQELAGNDGGEVARGVDGADPANAG